MAPTFAVYVSVIARKQPQWVPDLMGYQILMLKASNEYKGSSCLAYDRRFRQQAVAHPNCEWSKIDICYHCVYNPSATDINHKALYCPSHPSQQPATSQCPKPFSHDHDLLRNRGHS